METLNRSLAGLAAASTGLSVPIVAINWYMGDPPTWGTMIAALAMYTLATVHFARRAMGKSGFEL